MRVFVAAIGMVLLCCNAQAQNKTIVDWSQYGSSTYIEVVQVTSATTAILRIQPMIKRDSKLRPLEPIPKVTRSFEVYFNGLTDGWVDGSKLKLNPVVYWNGTETYNTVGTGSRTLKKCRQLSKKEIRAIMGATHVFENKKGEKTEGIVTGFSKGKVSITSIDQIKIVIPFSKLSKSSQHVVRAWREKNK